MKRILTLLAITAILSVVLFGAVMDGQWNYAGTDGAAPRTLNIFASGTTVQGVLDNINITNSGIAGAFFWFHVNRGGVDFLYKGQVKNGLIELQETSRQGNRVLTYAKVQ